MFVDSHVHLDAPEFDADRVEVIRRAESALITRALVVASTFASKELESVVRLVEQFPWLDVAVGVHPHQAGLSSKEDFERLSRFVKQKQIVAWGEIGLDFHYNHSPRDVQQDVFSQQLRLARDLELPVVIHTREAETETLQALEDDWQDAGLPGVLHCYSGSWELADACLEMGFFVSFSGMLTFPKAAHIREVASRVPLNRLLIETDAPYLAPIPYRGRRNEPAFVVETAKALCQIKEVSLEEIAAVTSANYFNLFRRAQRGSESGEAE